MDLYELLKWLHILSSTVLFGTGIGTAFHMVMAMRTRNPQTVAHTAHHVVLADWIFTTPAGIAQPLTGLALIYAAGYRLTEPWLVVTYALYFLAFVCWAPVVHLQIRLRSLARAAAATGTPLPPEATRAYHTWFALGWPAFASLTGVFWLMVAKPQLW